ncbi:MAG: acyl carrier protein [Firmicutes bacterium]|nr:acyl carrier protein [Bacillota bacterium]
MGNITQEISTELKNTIQEIIFAIAPEYDFQEDAALVDDEIIDSLDMVYLISTLNDTFGIEITVDDITPENFNTVDSIIELIQSKQE